MTIHRYSRAATLRWRVCECAADTVIGNIGRFARLIGMIVIRRTVYRQSRRRCRSGRRQSRPGGRCRMHAYNRGCTLWRTRSITVRIRIHVLMQARFVLSSMRMRRYTGRRITIIRIGVIYEHRDRGRRRIVPQSGVVGAYRKGRARPGKAEGRSVVYAGIQVCGYARARAEPSKEGARLTKGWTRTEAGARKRSQSVYARRAFQIIGADLRRAAGAIRVTAVW